MSSYSECTNVCTPNYDAVQAGQLRMGNNMAPQVPVLAGQYERLTHQYDPLFWGLDRKQSSAMAPQLMGAAGYTSITNAYGTNANCCATPYRPMGCCPSNSGSPWGYCNPGMARPQPPVNMGSGGRRKRMM